MGIKDKVKHVMGIDRNTGHGDRIIEDDAAGTKGGPEVGTTGEGRTTGHGSGQAISGATIGVAGLSVGNSGIHSGHRAALAKQDAERAAKEKPAPVVEEPVVEKEVVREPVVVERPVVAQQPRTVPVQSEFVHTTPIQPITQSAISDIPSEVPAGARLGHSTIISGPHNPHMEAGGVAGSGLASTPVLSGSGVTSAPAYEGYSGSTSGTTGLSSGLRGYTEGSSAPYGVQSGTGSHDESTAPTGPISGDRSSGQGSGYSAREVNPDGINYNHAGNIGEYRNVGNHKNEGQGVNDNTGYSGNTNVGGVTDSKGNPLEGTPMIGTDGKGVGGSFGQSERHRGPGNVL